MVVDTSALVAILLIESDSERFLDALVDASHVRISAATAVEFSIVAIARAGVEAETKVDLLFARCGAEIVPVNEAQALMARNAFRTFGKGRHPAALNFGDCFSYALAKAANEPLLYKGEDFRKTDLRSVL
ncbi:MAG: type II toxin-antitoxin system VapC family toxin [Alphaproteobacteria bacterium]|nr:type II toxin-antitoxin system VapC family toxin [Alphaproteobacteria bacterium]MDE2631321.1 type II toxin-antitoxin system VapC family toxin [Alphaproteobacteria bacterium]